MPVTLINTPGPLLDWLNEAGPSGGCDLRGDVGLVRVAVRYVPSLATESPHESWARDTLGSHARVVASRHFV